MHGHCWDASERGSGPTDDRLDLHTDRVRTGAEADAVVVGDHLADVCADIQAKGRNPRPMQTPKLPERPTSKLPEKPMFRTTPMPLLKPAP